MTTRTPLCAALAIALVGSAHAAVTPIAEDFDTGIGDNGAWASVGATATDISFDSNSANDFDKLDLIDTQGNALDGDGVVGNLAGDTEATGDGLLNDGGLRVNSLNATAGDEAIGLTVGGTLEAGEVVTLTMDFYNDNNSFHAYTVQLYNATDNAVLASDTGLVQGQGNANYRPESVTVSYTAGAGDVGDTLQLRVVENNNNTARDTYIDSYELTSVIPEPGSAALAGLGLLAMARRRR